MKLPRISLNINKSVVLSALLHGGAFLLGLSLAAPEIVPLPVGVELMYGDGGTERAPKVEEVKPVKIKTAVVADDSDAPALKNEKAETVEQPHQASSGKTMGSLAGTSDKGALEGREGVANGIEVSPEQRYLYEIKKLLERRKRYPVMAKKMGQSGKVTMRFTLAADGSLKESEIVEKTPYDSLNKAAHELVKGIDGMKPFPQEIQKTSWVITVPIEYSLN
ncbi:energy transducer TonB [Bdellovibrio sp. HCB-110]|uniref:energy transducer TonB n=1 Tax=Bdellovibrio sp. HCB-110 TaxID=3391182 RepID=UPI0039B688F8